MWFIRCHIVVHFNLVSLSLQLGGLQSWRYWRTGKRKQIDELATLPSFPWAALDEAELFVQEPANTRVRRLPGRGCPGVAPATSCDNAAMAQERARGSALQPQL